MTGQPERAKRLSEKENAPMMLPHAFKRITLNLARSKDFPSGSARHGYEFVAPLDAKGHIDQHLWHEHREQCRVRRFWDGADEQIGRLVHKPGGAVHAFLPGEYVSIRDEHGELHTFRVASVEQVT